VSSERQTGEVLGVRVDALSWEDAIDRLMRWAYLRESRMVAVCNAHVIVTASRDAYYRALINSADMATPDGAPVAWMLRRLGFGRQDRISGPDLMWRLCEQCALRGLAIYLYGSTEETITLLKTRLLVAFPQLKIAGMTAPPFRPMSVEEDSDTIATLNACGAPVVFVGLGCPRQETWMAEHRGRINAVMIGVGAAFDFHAGTLKRAPSWMRNAGLEWLHRLISEPRRLWRRYLVTNTLFLIGAVRQLMSL
jgi:N-acetylglucosaminyldiphosphoundecaprenol N-acetyl-beta-D-mannosaminyltransferase